jgi:peptide/nickel transport system substrate-binding protein
LRSRISIASAESIPKRFVPKVIARALACLALASVLGACSRVAAPSAGGNPWTRHGHFTYGEASSAKTLDPLLSSDAATGDLAMFIYSYAIRYDEHSKPHPDALREIPTLANGDVSKDGLTLKYKLRPHIVFHDGVPLTCRDLAFTWHVVMNPANNDVTQDGYRDIASIDCSDPLVAVIHMKKLYAPFLQQLWGVNGNAPILPEHLLAKYNDSKGSFNTAPYQAAPIGSGPFAFVRWDRGSQIVLKAFDRYFLGRPKLDTVVSKYIPDANTLIQQVRTHEIDMAVNPGAGAWPLMQNIPGTTLEAPPAYLFDHIDFNLRRPLFAHDVALRRALEMAVNRPELITKVAHGLGDLSDTALSPKLSYAWTDDTAHYPFNLAKAKAALDADGWKVGPDGIRVKNGVRLAFDLSTQTESTTGKAYQTVVQSQWASAGAAVTVKNTPTAQFFDNTKNGTLQGGHYDVAMFAWNGAADPDDSAIYSGKNMAPSGQNAIFWNDPIANAAMAAELASVDPAVRLKNFKIEQQQFASEVPSIVILFRRQPCVYNSDLKGYAASPVISQFWDPQDYSI